MNRRRRAGKVINLIDFQQNGLGHIMPNEFEAAVLQQVLHILTPGRKKVVETKHFMPVSDQAIAQMRPQKSRTACYQHPHGASKLPCGWTNCKAVKSMPSRNLSAQIRYLSGGQKRLKCAHVTIRHDLSPPADSEVFTDK
jgi:hypothetical protein